MITVTVTPMIPLGLTEPDVASLVSDLAEAARGHWIQLAQQHLHTTAQDYIESIQPVQLSGKEASIELTVGEGGRGALVKALELGASRFDLKAGLLKNAGPDGKVVVPFRHGTPESSRLAPMPTDIYAAMKKAHYGARIEKVKGGREALGRHPGGVSSAGYQRKGSVYSGMVKGGAARGAQYATFRTVSRNSPADSWIHPGFDARNFAEKVGKMVEEDFAAIAGNYLK